MTIAAPESPAASLRPPPARLIDEGDPAPYIRALDHTGKPVGTDADMLAGKPVVLLFCPSIEDQGIGEALAGLRGLGPKLDAMAVNCFVVSRGGVEINAAARDRLKLPVAVLADMTGDIFKAYGVDPYPAAPALTVFLLDAGHRAARVLDRPAPDALPKLVLDELAPLRAGVHAERLGTHPPVLVLPRMLSLADCAFLTAMWSRKVPEYATDGFSNAGTSREAGDFKVVHDGIYGKAVEYIVQDAALQRFLDGRLRRRLLPQIKKVFQATGLKREGYRIAGYEAREGGFLNPHRDNSVPANAQRRFTMTVNLNAGSYDGGELRFREYGEQLYAVERGTAIVWSASLLHEVLPVTNGRRLVLGVHMFAG